MAKIPLVLFMLTTKKCIKAGSFRGKNKMNKLESTLYGFSMINGIMSVGYAAHDAMKYFDKQKEIASRYAGDALLIAQETSWQMAAQNWNLNSSIAFFGVAVGLLAAGFYLGKKKDL
jgi:hypothetical protein